MVLDHRSYPLEVQRGVEKIAAVFNPDFRRYPQVRELIESATGGA